MPNSLIFIGERPSHSEMYIKGKPSFFDALQLSKTSQHQTAILPYHSIPLHQSLISIHILESNCRFHCRQQSLQLIEGKQQLSEEEAYDVFANFAIMEDNKVAILVHSDQKRIRAGEKEGPRVLSASQDEGV
ncbi:hypothetical protein [Bacillus sp. OK048]|uniref:hypothetical protein n=1 Tax=Bacillus sp. OK048 TaxID=1882761 RepID=UPI000887E07B|nr:hypothetical protein [Bacillus sp. OK048]SDN04222.1 hypothetical protein SAMN05443253_107256 [Bacillus sp. OK048]